MNRLIKANYNERTESFTYDLVGNRLSHTVNGENTTFIYNTKNQLTQLSKDLDITNFTYDTQGNILKESTPQGTTTFSYNALNQQVKVTTYQGNTLINRYDAEGLRAEIEENQKLARFIFHRDEILVETDQEDKAVSRLIRGYNVVAGDISSETYYYQLDEQFSTSFITNQTQKIVNSYTYDAFGNTLESQEKVYNRIRYTGQQYDAITQQYYLRARFYNPILGRFMQEDVYRGDGLNLYAYCSNNPVVYYDPSGYKETGHGDGEDKGNAINSDIEKKPIQAYEVATYEDFRERSVVGDNLEGHEVWQHANINENGYATTRLSTDASKKNPVIALPHDIHVEVNRAQYEFDARSQKPIENINANVEILSKNNKIPNSSVEKIEKMAKEHARNVIGDNGGE